MRRKSVGSLLPSELRKRLERAAKLVYHEGDPIPAVHQTKAQIADHTWHCPKCGKSLGLLKSLGKTCSRQGYLQCVDCFADIDCSSRKPHS